MAHEIFNSLRPRVFRPYQAQAHVHTDAVRELVQSVTEDEQAADLADLHDNIEEFKESSRFLSPQLRKFNLKGLHDTFGPGIVMEIMELSDVYDAEKFPSMNRQLRKFYEAARFSRASLRVRVVKLADIIVNTDDIVKHDRSFAKVYLKEKEMLLSQISIDVPNGDSELRRAFDTLLTRAKAQLELLGKELATPPAAAEPTPPAAAEPTPPAPL